MTALLFPFTRSKQQLLTSWGSLRVNVCKESTRNQKVQWKLGSTGRLISHPQLSMVQIKNDPGEKGPTRGLPLTNYTAHIKHKAGYGAAAKVFICIKRLSTYIIGIIIKKGNLERKLHIMAQCTSRSLGAHVLLCALAVLQAQGCTPFLPPAHAEVFQLCFFLIFFNENQKQGLQGFLGSVFWLSERSSSMQLQRAMLPGSCWSPDPAIRSCKSLQRCQKLKALINDKLMYYPCSPRRFYQPRGEQEGKTQPARDEGAASPTIPGILGASLIGEVFCFLFGR